jgi:hypothetical protein
MAWIPPTAGTEESEGGYWGDEPVDLAALEDIGLRVATGAEDLPEWSLDLVLASRRGVHATSAKLSIGHWTNWPDTGPRVSGSTEWAADAGSLARELPAGLGHGATLQRRAPVLGT